MPRVLLQLLAFALVSAGFSFGFVLLAGLADLALPGCGFLPAVRSWYRVDLELDPGGRWVVTRTVPMDKPQHPAPSSGVSIIIRESSVGRWSPWTFSAWRVNNWRLAGLVGQDGDLIGSIATTEAGPNCPPDLREALITHVERSVIPDSKVWELWPFADVRGGGPIRTASQDPLQWSVVARSTSGLAVTVALAVGATAGLTAALKLRHRPEPATTPPS